MKIHWHTKTLFLQWNKYKWSIKYDHCIKCKTCDYKHKGRWLCTRCIDKERYAKPKRKEVLRKSALKWSRQHTEEEKIRKNLIQKKYYLKNKEVLQLILKARRRVQRWLPCLQIIIKWKTRYLPFESLEKPTTVTHTDYEQWKENQRAFDLIRSFYNK